MRLDPCVVMTELVCFEPFFEVVFESVAWRVFSFCNVYVIPNGRLGGVVVSTEDAGFESRSGAFVGEISTPVPPHSVKDIHISDSIN